MLYEPKLGDAALDLARCLNSSYGKNGFSSKNFFTFYKNSLKIIDRQKNKIPDNRMKLIMSRLESVKDKSLDPNKRREDLLLASNLILKEHVRAIQFDKHQ